MENDMLFLLLCLLRSLLLPFEVPCSASLFLFCSSRKRSSCCLNFSLMHITACKTQSFFLLFFLPIVCFFSGGGEEWRGSITGMESYSVKKSKSGYTVHPLSLTALDHTKTVVVIFSFYTLSQVALNCPPPMTFFLFCLTRLSLCGLR